MRPVRASEDLNYQAIAIELIRALRGRRSCAEFSRRAGYRSNIAHRWEAGHCWPTAARFMQVQHRLRPNQANWSERFFRAQPDFLKGCDPNSPAAIAAFLRWLKGKTPVVKIAAAMGHNRYSVSRWFEGSAEPKLPEFLQLVEVTGRRLLDLLAALEDCERLPSVRERWARLQLARQAAYTQPFSHAVLRALELADNPRALSAQRAFLADRLGISEAEVEQALRLLMATGQVKRTRRGLRPAGVMTVNTSHDPAQAREIKLVWTQTALARLQRGAPGDFGYSLFAISRADLHRLQQLHLSYVRAMQAIIARSSPNECVGLYCAQLIDLGASADDGTHR